MDLPTYTSIWRIEKRLYKLYDFRLPSPVPMATAGIFVGALIGWIVLLNVLRVPFDFGNGWHLVLWVLPPGLIAFAATRPVAEGKRLGELLASHAKYLREARLYTRLRGEYEPTRAQVQATVWHQPTPPDRHSTPASPRRRLPPMPLPQALTHPPATTAPSNEHHPASA